MGSLASPDRESLPSSPRLVRVLRVALALSLLPWLALTVLYVLGPRLPLPNLPACISLGLGAVVLWRMRTTPPTRFGLLLTAALGSLWVVLFGYYAFQITASLFGLAPGSSADIALLLGGTLWVLTLLQGACVGVAWKFGRSMSSGGGDPAKCEGAFAGGGICGVLVILVIGFFYLDPPGQAPAVGMLRTINTAEITYALTYERGYTSSLAELVPPPRGMQPSASAAGMIDSALASGIRRYRTFHVGDDLIDEVESALGRAPRHAYRIIYQPGPRDEKGIVNSYTICARPIGQPGISYFTDETGVIRMTSEDRCPTVKDWNVAG